MVRTAGVGCLPHGGTGELALDPGTLASVRRAIDEEGVLELGRELHHEVDRDLLAELRRRLPRDVLARGPSGEAREDRYDLHRQERLRPDALGVAEQERATETPILDDDRLDRTKARAGRG